MNYEAFFVYRKADVKAKLNLHKQDSNNFSNCPAKL